MNPTVEIICLEETGSWQANILTDGEHQTVYVSDGNFIDTFPVESDGTVIWSSDNLTYPGYFWIGYDEYNMYLVDTSQCGVYYEPPMPFPSATIVAPPATPPPTDVYPVSDNVTIIPNILILLAVIALVMRLTARKI